MKNFPPGQIRNLVLSIFTLNKGLKLIIFLVICGFFASFLFTKINLPAALDLPRQIANGRDILHGNFDVLTKNVYSYTEPDQPFANHHWLFGVISYILLVVSGWKGIAIVKIVLMVASFVFLFWFAKKRSNFWLTSLFAIPTIMILVSRTAFRPELFSYIFIIIFLYILLRAGDEPKSNTIFWLIPLQLVWVNIHIFFPIGILLVAGFLFEQIVLNFKDLLSNGLIRKLFFVLSVLVVSLFVNPFGLGGVIYSLLVNTSKDFPIHSMEVTSLFDALRANPSTQNIYLYVFLPFVGLLVISFIISFVIRRRRKIALTSDHYLFYLIISVGSAGLSYFVFRAMPIFGVIFLLSITSINLQLWNLVQDWCNRQTQEIVKVLRFFLVSLLLGLIFVSIVFSQTKIITYFDQGVGLATDSLESAQFFKNNNLKGPIFNDTDVGSYLIGELYPQEKVFADNRFGDAYSSHFFSDLYLPIITDEDKWKEALDNYRFNVIFMYQYNAGDGVKNFIFNRIYDPEWVWVYVDKDIIILVRNIIENKDVIDKYQITKENLNSKLEYLSNSKNPTNILSSADILNLIGRTDLSIPLYLKYVSLRPNDGEIWFVLGKTELRKVDQTNSNPGLAAVYLERAIKEGWTTWESYSFLALAYFRTGQLDKVKEAVKQEEKIVPNSQDLQKWKQIISDTESQQKNGK